MSTRKSRPGLGKSLIISAKGLLQQIQEDSRHQRPVPRPIPNRQDFRSLALVAALMRH
jgi:hypothetical protein